MQINADLDPENVMKKFLLATVALSALVAAPAMAADLAARPYTKAPAFIPAPIYNWTGFYIGGNAGYSFADRTDINTSGQVAANADTVARGLRNPLVSIDRNGSSAAFRPATTGRPARTLCSVSKPTFSMSMLAAG